ncbi:TonB-dependent receptor domain-containing protein [Sulfurospirillum arcachonense]|uniref:TonB-dependent receptor domain-containing protein n=1 Tax=Sulfurospirillum arcachonense TaxID=57666 RepID=UPI0004693F96|nr:TonB-dependent receptor [Sulfurospirillum arcachonense]
MNKSNFLLSSVAAFTLLNTQAITAETTSLDEIDITTTEVEVVSSSINLGQTSMETKQADHLSDLFRDIPGVDVGGSHSMNNKIIIRGIKDEDLYITIDGAKQSNTDMFHHQGSLKINPDILKKASIEVGANSVVHGGLGGAIEFETKEGKDFLQKDQKIGGMVSSTYNSNKSLGGSLAGFGKITDYSDFFVYYNYLENKNWKTGDGTTEKGREGTLDDILIKYGIDINDEQRISFSYDKMVDEGDYLPRPNFSTATNVSLNRGDIHPTKYERDTYTIKHEINKGDALQLKTSLYYNKMDLTRKESNTNLRGDVLEALVINKGINSKAQSNIESGNILNTLTYGLLYDIQTSEVDIDGSDYGDDEKATTMAIFLEDAIDFDNGFILTPGVRFNNYNLDGIAGDIKDNKLTYSLAAEYELTNNLTLLASHTTLFKGVPMQEVFASYRTFVGENSNIKSETGENNEIGFKYIQDDILGANNIGFSAKYFRTTIDNDIGFDDSNNLINQGKTVTKGVEASFAYNLEKLNALLTFSHAESLVEDTGNPIDDEVGDNFSLNLKYRVSSELEASWKSILVLEENDIPDVTKKGYDTHDIALKYTPKSVKGLKVIAGIDNLFDKHYASHSSVNRIVRGSDGTDYEPGRNFKLTLSYKY